jgi:hypothetical protein
MMIKIHGLTIHAKIPPAFASIIFQNMKPLASWNERNPGSIVPEHGDFTAAYSKSLSR